MAGGVAAGCPGLATRTTRRQMIPRIGISPTNFSGSRPIVLEPLQLHTSAMKVPTVFHVDLSDRLMLLRKIDPLRKWVSLDDRRFCRCCHKFISGRQIEIKPGYTHRARLACPTSNCSSTVEDWVYPNEIAQPPDSWGRRVIRVVDKQGETFVVGGRQHTYSRRRPTERIVLGSNAA